MKITVLMLAALLSLSGCILVPENGRDDGQNRQDRGREHDRGHDRDHCDHDGHCDQHHD